MLILSRKAREKIRIGDDIEVIVLGHRGDQYRVGVHAPSGVPIHREEVYQAIRRNEAVQTEAAEGSASVTEDLCHAR